MDKNINNRIKKLRKEILNLTQDSFGFQLGLTKTAISRIESGKNNATERLKTSICKEWNVRMEWLENGTGEVFETLTKEERVAKLLGNIFTDTDSELYDFKMSIFQELGKLDESDWKILLKIIKGIEWK